MNTNLGKSVGVDGLFVRPLLRAALLSTISFAAAQSVLAQEAPISPAKPGPSVSSTTDSTNAGEVVVTARRREERLRGIPIAASVVSGASLEIGGGITTAGDFLAKVPGARYNNVSSPILSEVSVRASGTGRATNADSAVGLFANGVYVAGGLQYGRNFATIDYFDLDRAEVLRGSQGALYGRNAVEGVVNLISAQPDFKDEGKISGQYNVQTQQRQEMIIINHPINDEISIRLGAEDIQQSKGFVLQPDTNSYVDHTSGFMGRAQIRYKTAIFDGDLLFQTQQLLVPANNYNLAINPNVTSYF